MYLETESFMAWSFCSKLHQESWFCFVNHADEIFFGPCTAYTPADFVKPAAAWLGDVPMSKM
jgi:hypothetical protein